MVMLLEPLAPKNGSGNDISVTFNSVTANGSSTQTTTQLILTFDKAITGLTADDITLSGVSNVNKGTLSDSNPYTLPISGFTTGGILTVETAKSGYAIIGSPKTVSIAYHSLVEMVQIPGGSFQMGKELGTDGLGDVMPVHTVTLSGFYMGKYEVTQEKYQTVMGSNPSYFTSSPASGEVQGKRPVERVSWYDALVFCNKLSMMEGLNPAYSISGSTNPAAWGTIPTSYDAPNRTTWDAVVIVSGSNGYRLPTETQWEYAAKGGDGSPGNYTYSGSNNVGDVAWYSSNSDNKTHEVGKKAPNGLGLYDMSGNVWEWCWDLYPGADYRFRMLRGGGWDMSASYIRSISWYRDYPYYGYGKIDYCGFRLVCPDDGNGSGNDISVTLNSVTANGSSTQTTTQLTLTFDKAITGLSANDITLSGVSGVSKGTLSGSNPYTLPISGFTSGGTLNVSVTKSGYNISGSPKAIYIYVPVSFEMVSIPGGSFQMGDVKNEGYSSEKPVHTVTLSAFKMGNYEVMQEQWVAVMGNNPSSFTSSPAYEEVQGNLPVVGVSWYDALVFCNKLSMREGLRPAYIISGSTDPTVWGSVPTSNNSTWDAVQIVDGSNGYRLPTEAQWEYAAKGGNGSPGNYTYSGSDTVGDVAWYSDNSDSKTHEAGKKAPNGLGLYDMSGNVWEWCWDWYGDYSSGAQNNPTGVGFGSSRVLRGGSWHRSAEDVRSTYRTGIYPNSWSDSLGFRLVCPVGDGGGNTTVTLNSVTANGSTTQTTTQLTLAFDKALAGLTASDITLSGVSGVSKGTLSGSNPYTLPISGFTSGGTLTVSVAKVGYVVSGTPKTVTINYIPGDYFNLSFYGPTEKIITVQKTTTNDFSKSSGGSISLNIGEIFDEYEWFVGETMVASGKSVTLYASNAAFVPGHNWITVVVYEGTTPYSGEFLVMVAD
ncbi:formylglycine-generating enzyme family protein [Treponema sp. R8-4-B8]